MTKKRDCWFYDMKYSANGGCNIIEYRATTTEPPGTYRMGHFWRSDVRLTDEEIRDWFGFERWHGEVMYAREVNEIVRSPEPPASLCEEYVVCDGTFTLDDDKDKEHRCASILRANFGGECWSSATICVRSPEFHSQPEGPAEELAYILAAAEQGYDESFKRIAVKHEPGDIVVVWSPRNAWDDEPSDWLRMPKARLIELLRGWLRPEELTHGA
jgi:hypothetical protein